MTVNSTFNDGKQHIINDMKQILILLLLQLCMVAQAQIPAEVTEIMKKCGEKFNNNNGLELDMKLHVGAVIISMDGTMKMCMKGDKSF